MERKRDSAEHFAVQAVLICSKQLAEVHPEIADDARLGMKVIDIATKHRVSDLFHVTQQIAKSITAHALRLLLSKEERETAYRPRIHQAHILTGHRTHALGVGLWGRTPEQRTADSKKSGGVAGRKTVIDKTGLFGLTSEELSQRQKEGRRTQKNSWYNEDHLVDSMTEAAYALMIAAEPAYQIPIGQPFAGSPDYTKITVAVNIKFGMNRSRMSVKGFFENRKKKKYK